MPANVMIVVQGQNDAKAALNSVKRDLQGVTNEASRANRMMGGMGKILGTGMKIAAGVAVAAGAAAVGGMVAMGVKGTKIAANFQQQMANVQAIVQASDADLAKLSQRAMDLGIDPNLKVRASEAGAIMEMLGKNGLKVEEIMGGATRATILLANATGSDFAFSADVATDAMQIFNKEASEMEATVASMVTVQQNSKFDMQDYAIAIANGGVVVASAGVEFDEYNALLALTASNFKGGQRAGTSFSYLFRNLFVGDL